MDINSNPKLSTTSHYISSQSLKYLLALTFFWILLRLLPCEDVHFLLWQHWYENTQLYIIKSGQKRKRQNQWRLLVYCWFVLWTFLNDQKTENCCDVLTITAEGIKEKTITLRHLTPNVWHFSVFIFRFMWLIKYLNSLTSNAKVSSSFIIRFR